jgi:SAM-dependent methyltransferase
LQDAIEYQKDSMSTTLTELPRDSFIRADDTDDAVFYATDRMVHHLDSLARCTIEDLIGQLLIEDGPVVLDLMASCDSHIPDSVKPSRVVGLGLNEREMASNSLLNDVVLHDLNKTPELPFEENTFDAVLCTVSVDYMTEPFRVFSEVGRILKPGGVFLVTFSNRYFQEKVVKIWRHATGEQRIHLVESYFEGSFQFEEPTVFVSRGKPRPADDKYSPLGVPSDPVFAVYADKKGGFGPGRPVISSGYHDRPFDWDEVNARKLAVKHTLECPYCGRELKRIEVPDTPFTEWSSDHICVCLFDECPYFLFGWDAMSDQGGTGSYRFMYEPAIQNCYMVPVTNRLELRNYVIEDV